MAQFDEAIDVNRQTYDAMKSTSDGFAYKIVRRVELLVAYGSESPAVGIRSDISLGLAAWRQLRLECLPRPNGSAINNMVRSLFVAPANGSGDSRNNIGDRRAHAGG